MPRKQHSFPRLVVLFICIIVILSVIITSIQLLFNGSDYFEREAEVLAIQMTSEKASAIGLKITGGLDVVQELAKEASGVSGYDAVDAFGEAQVKKYEFACLQFVKDGSAVYRYGEGVGDFSSPVVASILGSSVPVCSDVFDDPALGTSCVAMYCPVSGSSEMDGVLAYKQTDSFISGLDGLPDEVLFYAVTEKDGHMMESYVSENFASDVSHNTFKYLYNVCQNRTEADAVVDAASANVPQACVLTINGDFYVAGVVPLTSFGYGCTVITVFSRAELLHGEYSLYDKLIGAVAILTALCIAAITVAFISVRRRLNEKQVIVEVDSLLGCSTLNRFKLEASEILKKNRISHFAVCYLGIRNYAAITAEDSAETADEILHRMTNVLTKALRDNECFGHVDEDQFVFMFHYMDRYNLADKLKVISALVANPPSEGEGLLRLTPLLGVFLTKEEGSSDILNGFQPEIADAVNNAKIAYLAHNKEYTKPFIVYDDTLGTTYEEDAKVEGKMQMALENREFRLFFQPKYSIENHKLDSAEVLVRWYDEKTKTYRPPAAFLRVFETNGFIIKIDHYVFRETCLFLKKMRENGQKTVPLSVNVSRVTAVDPGFAEFYRKTKEELGIPNDYITLEFAESFVVDSYDTMSRIMPELQKCGFICSIDGFGSAGASLESFSNLALNEVKIDRKLLLGSGDRKKDAAILGGIYRIAQGLGLNLVQEGVETSEQLSYANHLGCSIIQGYYYAKPLYMTDFIDFINDSRMSSVLRA